MFRSAAIKLTTWYLVIIMAISFVFSLSLYQVSSADLGRSVNRQIRYFNGLLGPGDLERYTELRHNQLDYDLNHLRNNLVLFNLLVFALGGAASYWLARRTLQPIEEALRAQSRFAADASHELRTPLAAIQTENEVALRNKNLPKSQAISILKSNLEEVAKLKALSEGLLRLAGNSGRIAQPKPVPLKEIVGPALVRYQKALQAKKITLTDLTGGHIVCGDRDSLVELLSIFIDNAIKYSPAGSTIKLSSKKNGKQVLVNITDNGCGISKADLPRIFERFYRLDNSRTKNENGGYGLGLAIAKRITEAHCGFIEVSSTPGKGTSFTIFLPAA